MDGGENGFLIGHPVESGVGEDGVEFAVEWQLIAAENASVEAEGLGRFDHRKRAVHANNLCAGRSDFRGERSITAAEIENALTCLRCKEFKYAAGNVGDEAALLGVLGRIPGL